MIGIQQYGSPASLADYNACALTQTHIADPLLIWTNEHCKWPSCGHISCEGVNAKPDCSQSDCRYQDEEDLGDHLTSQKHQAEQSTCNKLDL